MKNLIELISWFKSGEEAWLDHGSIAEFIQIFHPRACFVKTLKRHAKLLDMGAGNGALEVLRHWPKPERKDLQFYAYAMDDGERFGSYNAFELGEWPKKKPNFNGILFDAILCAHFIEHLPDPFNFLEWAVSRLKPDGRLYLEWPSEIAKKMLPKSAFQEQGIPIMISNFHDDRTHVSIPSRAEVCITLEKSGLTIDQQGVISNPFLDQEILAHYKQAGKAEVFWLQSIFWSHTKWAQFVIASKPN